MANVIEFLEKMGADAALRHMRQDRLEAALVQSGVDAEMRAALLARDTARVGALLGANGNVSCLLAPGRDDEDDPDDHDDDDEISVGDCALRNAASAS